MTDLTALVKNPSLASGLSVEERAALRRQCAVMILLLSEEPPVKPVVGPDQLLTAKEVATRLNLSEAWVRDHAETDLKSVRITLGGALRFSERALDALIRDRRGD